VAATVRRRTGTRPLSGAAGALLVFLSSGAVLVLELSALRLLAPYVGLTLEMSTAVIGVALAAIAFGTWAGGRSADRVDPARALGPLLLAGGVLIWLVLPAVRGVGELTASRDVSLVLLLAVVTVFVPAALLSAVTPMVIRLQLRDLDRTGSVVGRLSAVGTLGALLATFGTGFVLFAHVPTSTILIALGAIVALAGAVLLVWQSRRQALAVGAAAAVLVGVLTVMTPAACDVETRYHCASVRADPERPDGQVLVLDRLRHSYVDTQDPTYLDFAYVRAIAAGIDATYPDQQPVTALHLGAGGMTLPRYLAASRPGSTGAVLEIDAGVVALVRERIGPEPPGVDVRVADARTALADQPDDSFDVVVGDAFGSVAVPWHLATVETVEEVRRTLRPGGLYALNVIDQPPLALLRAQLTTVGAVFDDVVLVSEPGTLAGAEGGNSVLLASSDPVQVDRLTELLRDRAPTLAIVREPGLTEFVGSARVLTDDLAPVDQLLTPYVVRD
jgi:spermidine synthase